MITVITRMADLNKEIKYFKKIIALVLKSLMFVGYN